MNPYVPVFIVLVLALVLGGLLSSFSALLGPRKPTKAKKEIFECGVPQVNSHQEKMSVKYYMTAILFILFDIETIFIYLWARTFQDLGWFGIFEIIVFMFILITGYIYVLKRGALEWD
ncbi:MAG: NADH-quinone oxidoreductase subunit A [Oligoflexales bacterium]|nr:NADH-quinone oxidoreductase subunit A [Oligoflexales bacterium]